jgi:SAM-dependent methyltransferase
MQDRHFWYRGRHRFLLHSVHRQLAACPPRRMIDLGGGCGGWVSYMAARGRVPLTELALADSSADALRMAAEILPPGASTYQVDLLALPWSERWDVAFLLDVLEHIPEQEEALRQVHRSLAPGGLLFVTVPALRLFWSWNDEAVHHVRRYARSEFPRLAAATGFELVDARYFMFFLSPLLLASRVALRPRLGELSAQQVQDLVARMHRTPSPPVNALLGALFALETPLGHYLPFPLGSSLLAVLKRPAE